MDHQFTEVWWHDCYSTERFRYSDKAVPSLRGCAYPAAPAMLSVCVHVGKDRWANGCGGLSTLALPVEVGWMEGYGRSTHVGQHSVCSHLVCLSTVLSPSTCVLMHLCSPCCSSYSFMWQQRIILADTVRVCNGFTLSLLVRKHISASKLSPREDYQKC